MKNFLWGNLALFLLLACNSVKAPDTMHRLKKELLTKIAAFPEATVAVAYKNLSTGAVLLIHEKEIMHAASTMKVPVMIEVFKQAENGHFSLKDSLLVNNEFKSIMDDSHYSMDIDEDSDESIYPLIGKKMSVLDLTFQMITVSSNLATNILIDLVGAENVMTTLKEIGANEMQVLRGVEDIKAYRAGKNNVTTAYDLMLVMEAVAAPKVVSLEAGKQMLQILKAQKFNDKIPALLPPQVEVAHKTGWITKIDHDAAIVYPEIAPPFILVVLTKGIADRKQSNRLISEISRMIFYDHLQSHS